MQMKLLQHQFRLKDDTRELAVKRMNISEFEAGCLLSWSLKTLLSSSMCNS